MYMECDELAVDKDVWKAAQSGDRQAINKLIKQFHGMFLYEHILSIDKEEARNMIPITIRQLNELRTGYMLTVKIEYENYTAPAESAGHEK